MINVPAIFSKSTAMTGPEANRNIIAVGAVVPRDVEDGILALPVAFPAHRAQDEGERNLAARLRLEAFEGFEVFIAVFVLKRVRLRNPRHPFPPNGQDLFDLAGKTRNVLQRAVTDACLSGNNWFLYSSDLPAGWFDSGTPPPFAPGSIIPDYVACQWIHDYVAKTANLDKLRDVNGWSLERYRANAYLADYLCSGWSAAAINTLPETALPVGFRTAYEAAIARLSQLRQEEDDEREKEAAAGEQRRRRKHGTQACDAECAANSGCVQCSEGARS